MRRPLVVAVFLTVFVTVFSVPGVASADVIFDPADADELAATLADAYERQDVCYGWSIAVNNEGLPESSVGSNFGVGQSLEDNFAQCTQSVEFQADIIWTPESSEADDDAQYQVVSTPGGPSTEDLEGLEIISEDGLVSETVDVDVYKAVAALPLLAADTGMADPIEASPAAETDSGDAVPTDSPGSDFWRESGMLVLWAVLLLVAGGAFAWYAIRSSRRPGRRRTIGPVPEQIPEYVPPEWSPGPGPAVPAPTPEPEATERAEPAVPPPAEPAKPDTKPDAEPDSKPDAKSDPETRPEG
ncbi:hypothetical protein [Actinophytocola sp.]|uniref:hypothetical protein n=1 Tax=Actinophytocola sp. TaxID=1872138 RepID=UPI003D6C3D2D